MSEIDIKLENCFGIRMLENKFNFQKANSILIYAPNGVMKTSFAKTFKKIAEGKLPEELIYGRTASYSIKIDGSDVQREQVLVVEPFNPNFDDKNLSTLLVNSKLKEEYDSLLKAILESKKKLIATLNKVSKIKKGDIENQITSDFGANDFFDAILKLKTSADYTTDYLDIEYAAVFDPKVLELLKTPDVSDQIQRYIETYNKLISSSKIFVKDVFSPIKAASISTALCKENYFKAQHKVILNGIDEEIQTDDRFNAVLSEQNKVIQDDPTLKKISEKILNGVNSIKAFQELLSKKPELSADLSDLQLLRKKIWKSYYISQVSLFDSLLKQFDDAKEELKKIEDQASLEKTQWFQAVEEFKTRFHVPFELSVENMTNTILGTTAPNIQFHFLDGTSASKLFNRGQLNSLDTLSMGERRALYLLYIIFEIKARLTKGLDTIIIVDDIADSFDYKNKYAIIEYLKEMSKESPFKLFVLTHNFDFYRTYQGRVLDTAKWDNSFIAESDNGNIRLMRGGDRNISDPFSTWKRNFHENELMFVSMIPFIRNLIEFREGKEATDYEQLTSMLHVKNATYTLQARELWDIINRNIASSASPTFNLDRPIVDLIIDNAHSICTVNASGEFCLERKICLSIAIRIKAEKYMLDKLSDKSYASRNQTSKLYNRYVEENESNSLLISAQKQVLGQVILMTPENIHLNSFMYEPLIDLSDRHLINLYNDVNDLK